MELLSNDIYLKDIENVANSIESWEKLFNSTILITGASGMIGSFLIDVLMYKNINENLNCKIIAIGRNTNKAKIRFKKYWKNEFFKFISQDINKELNIDLDTIDYIIHAASNTHPIAYATDPIGTVLTNIIGTNNLLEFAVKHNTKRFIFTSSVEIYGENRGDIEKFNEMYCGYIDSNTLRSGYPESKRAGEALCQAYIKQKGLDIVIPRLARTFGPTMLMSDTKAISQFIKNGIAKENIVLKSEGNQYYSYTYVADAVSGILKCLFDGKCGEAYNISDSQCDITLKDLAHVIASIVGTDVIYELPEENERIGYSKATTAILCSEKIKLIGWKSEFNIRRGLENTLKCLSNI